MLSLLRRLFGVRRPPRSSPARPPRLPSDLPHDHLRHEAGQGRTAPPRVEDAPEPPSRTLEGVIAATTTQRGRGPRGG
jgi:hypothetical protein